MAEAVVVAKTKRELVMEHVWTRCTQAWIEGDFEQAANLDNLFCSIEGMTDEEFERAYECDCKNCDCQE